VKAISSDNSQKMIAEYVLLFLLILECASEERGSKWSSKCVCVLMSIIPQWRKCVFLVGVEKDLCSAAVSEASQGLESRIKAGTKREKEN